MKQAIDIAYGLLEALLVAFLAGMVAFVFANAVARYAFDYSIRIADELPRVLFVWLTFIGAAVAHRRSLHLGMSFVVSSLPRSSWRMAMGITEATVIVCCALLVWGGLLAWHANATMRTPILGLPLVVIHVAALVSAALMAATSIHRVVRVLSGRVTEAELASFAEADRDEGDSIQGRFE